MRIKTLSRENIIDHFNKQAELPEEIRDFDLFWK